MATQKTFVVEHVWVTINQFGWTLLHLNSIQIIWLDISLWLL